MNAADAAGPIAPAESPQPRAEREIHDMRFAMRLSLSAGVLMLFMKGTAYFLTGSAAILSDAAESIVHIFAVVFATYSLRLSMKPADETHTYGHDRITFFSAGFEGAMIVIAALYIIVEAVHKWLAGLALENLGAGTAFTVVATILNGVLGLYLVRQGKKYHSLVLEANGKHVLTDSWTSLGVIIALVLTMVTGWLPFDPILAIIVALNILWTGGKLMRQSIGGLMDESDPRTDGILKGILERESARHGIVYHGLRHRNAGSRLLVDVHLLFPDGSSIAEAHETATLIEQEIRKSFRSQVEFTSHLEPLQTHDEIHERLLAKDGGSPGEEPRP